MGLLLILDCNHIPREFTMLFHHEAISLTYAKINKKGEIVNDPPALHLEIY